MRGTMLLTSVGKLFHSVVRGRMLPWIENHRSTHQYGGFKAMQTSFASLMLHSFVHVCTKQSYSTAVIFLDLKAAFHMLLREVAFGSASDLPPRLQAILQKEGFDVDGLRSKATQGEQTFLRRASPVLAQNVQQTHTHTWYVLPGDSMHHQTFRGSRPGSPLADVAFNALMVQLLPQIDEVIAACGPVQAAMRSLGVQAPLIAWVDDLAIPVATCAADQLDQCVTSILGSIKQLLSSYGMQLNLGVGKTEAVAFYRGRHAPACRQHRFVEQHAQLSLLDGAAVTVVGSYKHLGVQFGQRAALERDLHQRLGRAADVFRQLSRAVFKNRRISLATRFQLLESLVLSVVFHGAGAWPLLAPALYTRVQHCVTNWQRVIAGIGYWTQQRVTDQAFRAVRQLPELSVRLAKMRLALAMQVSQVAPASLQTMLERERDVFDHSWLHAVLHAKDWFLGMLPPDHPVQALFQTDHVFMALQQLATEYRGHGLLRRAYHKYLLQEKIAQEVLNAGDTFKTLIADAGIETAPGDVETPAATADFLCPQCGMAFSTPQGRQAHCWKQHGALSLERRLSFGVTCRACHLCLSTSARIQQHLRNSRLRGHGCYYILAERFLPDAEPEQVSIPPHLAHLERVPAQMAEGPMAPLPPCAFFPPAFHVPDWKQAWCQANLSWRLLKDDYQRIAEDLDRLMADAALQDHPDLLDAVIGLLDTVTSEGPLSAPDIEWAYTIWFRRQQHGGWPRAWDDSWHRQLLDSLHPLCDDLVPYQLLENAQKIPGCLRDLPDGWVEGATHDGRQWQPREPFALRYPQLGNVFENWRDRRRLHALPELPVPVLQDESGQPCLVILHLFSGRRRLCDFHHWVRFYLGSLLPGYTAMVLSVDTAVDSVDGNLASGPAIAALQELTTAPAVAGAAAGPSPTVNYSNFRWPTTSCWAICAGSC
eukprot:Skav202840  [mRNA]  locus=scaffold746:116692:119493:+ [translate_table: standard]